MHLNNLKNLQDKRATLTNTARSIIDRAASEGRALRPAEEVDLEGLTLKIHAINRTIRVADNAYRDFSDDPRPTRAGLVEFARALNEAQGDVRLAIQGAQVKNPDLARALSASVATAGGFAVPDDYNAEVIEALRPLVAVRKLNPTIIPSPHGNVTWPKIPTPSAPTSGQENTAVATTQPGFGALQLSAKKMSGLVPISNSWLRTASPAGDLIVKNDLIASAASLEDLNFLRGDGSNNSTFGLRNQALVANVIAANGTVSLTNTSSDLKSLVSALMNANVRMIRPGFIFAPRTELYLRELRGSDGIRAFPEMQDGLLMGYRYASTTNVPTNLGGGSQSEIYFADFADVVVADYPIAIGIASGVYKDASNNTVSAFSQDQSLIRIVVQSDIGMRHRESLAILTGVTWS